MKKRKETLLNLIPKTTLDEIDVENYNYKVYGLDNNLFIRLFTKEKIPSATKRELLGRAFRIFQIIWKHHLTKEGLSPIKLRVLLEDLGPTFVKMGQIMSKRTELLPKNYCQELEKLCEESNPLEFDVVKDVIENEFGKPIYELFESFEQKPIGSASIGQVHKAILKDTNKEVVVKIQRPNIDVIMRRDIMLLRLVLKPLKLAPSIGGTIDLYKILEDLWKITQQELNFFVEATNTIKFKNITNKYDGINCPEIIRNYTTQKVLTMEYINGFSITNEEKLKEYNIDKQELGNKLANNYISQVLKEDFFHADPHQGNIMIRIVNDTYEIVWIDFGMIRETKYSEQQALKKVIQSVIGRDTNGMIFAIMSLGMIEKDIDYSNLYKDVDYLLNKYSSINLSEINIGNMLNDILNVVSANGIVFSSTINILARGLVMIEGILAYLTKDINIMDILKDYTIKDMKESKEWKTILQQNGQNIITSIQKGIEIPALSNDIMRSVLKGQAKLNISYEETYYVVNRILEAVSSLIFCFIICALIIGSSICCLATNMHPQLFGIPIICYVLSILAIVLAFILLIKIILFNKNTAKKDK